MVMFYDIDDATGAPTTPVLYLDTLKVSTVEQTAQTSEARGGKGNAALISWDFGKEINVTLEDALFSAKSMAIMFGNGTVDVQDSGATLKKTIAWTAQSGAMTVPTQFEGPQGKKYAVPSTAVTYNAVGSAVSTFTAGNTYYTTFEMPIIDKCEIEVSANSFPGTYYITADTFARSEVSGNDEFFQLIFTKAKVLSDNTITLQAEGDPSTFNMNLKLLRPANGGAMMKLVKYDMTEVGA